jgi:folylpolyglutamate synthase/dihydropteroate synthase
LNNYHSDCVATQLFSACEREAISANFFEYATVLSLCAFRTKGVQVHIEVRRTCVLYPFISPQVAVLETGLGGALDATNFVQPAVSVITSVCHRLALFIHMYKLHTFTLLS